jgi:NAD(P)-dependent dehydrogenase (short-subunit alcohol dehydrogenase family)
LGSARGIDVLVNNAGIGMQTVNPRFMTDPQPFWTVEPDRFRDLFATNVTGYFLVARAVAPVMAQTRKGKIVNVSVSESTMRRAGFAPYGPSRAATDSLSHIMAADLAGTGVTVNLLAPGGATATGMIPDDVGENVRAGLLAPAIMGPPIRWLASAEVLWNNPKLAEANQDYSAKAAGFEACDASLKTFAHMAVAAQIGCSWCLDINYFLAQNQRLDLAKASQVPRWRESEVFSPLERDVLEYAEAMTCTPPTVTDELYAGLLDRLGPAAMVELTWFIAFANMASRSNTAHGITSQGFSDACEVPLAHRTERSEATSMS